MDKTILKKLLVPQLVRFLDKQTNAFRLIALLIVALIIYGLFALVWLSHERAQKELLTTQLTNINHDLLASEQQWQTLSKPHEVQLDHTNQSLQQKINLLKEKLGLMISQASSQQEILAAVVGVMQKAGDVNILKAENLAPKPLANDDALLSQWAKGPLVEQGIALEFEANFAATLRYLQHLQQVKPHFASGTFDYQVAQYPTATIKLELHYFSQ